MQGALPISTSTHPPRILNHRLPRPRPTSTGRLTPGSSSASSPPSPSASFRPSRPWWLPPTLSILPMLVVRVVPEPGALHDSRARKTNRRTVAVTRHRLWGICCCPGPADRLTGRLGGPEDREEMMLRVMTQDSERLGVTRNSACRRCIGAGVEVTCTRRGGDADMPRRSRGHAATVTRTCRDGQADMPRPGRGP